MASSKKKLGISPFSGHIYFGTVGIDIDGLEYWKTKEDVSISDFIFTMLEFIKQNEIEPGVMNITVNGEIKKQIRVLEVSEQKQTGTPKAEEQDLNFYDQQDGGK